MSIESITPVSLKYEPPYSTSTVSITPVSRKYSPALLMVNDVITPPVTFAVTDAAETVWPAEGRMSNVSPSV